MAAEARPLLPQCQRPRRPPRRLPCAGAPVPKTPNYVAIPMSIDVNKPAADVWAKVGGWCDISNWIAAGRRSALRRRRRAHGEVGSVRMIADARHRES